MVFVRAYDWEPATGLGFRALSSAWEPGISRAMDRRLSGARFNPAPSPIKSAISGVRMGHLGPHGGVAMTFY
jgi:hypothetical protein